MFSYEIYFNIFDNYDFLNFREIKELSMVNKMFYNIIKKLLIRISLKKINNKYQITIEEKSNEEQKRQRTLSIDHSDQFWSRKKNQDNSK